MAHLDLQWLVLFAEIYKTQSVSRAAERLGLSQPNASIALARLRHHFDDVLFCRTSKGMEPTARAKELLPDVQEVVQRLEKTRRRSGFDASKARRKFKICMADVGSVVLLPPLLNLLQDSAPGIAIEAHKVSRDTQLHLEGGELDLAVGYMPYLEAGFYQQTLFKQDFVCLASTTHPRIKSRLTKARYCAEGHIVVTDATPGQVLVERTLAKRGASRRVALYLPSFLGVAWIVSKTELLVTTPRLLGLALVAQYPVRMLAPPFEMPEYDVKQHWHQRVHADPANAWLRGVIARIAAEQVASGIVSRSQP